MIKASVLTAAVLALPFAASAAEVCGRVELAGRPLPEGFVSLAGKSVRGPFRVRDGAFCAAGVEPGSYRVTVSPLNFPEPLEIARKGEAPSAGGARLDVDAAGRAAPLELEAATPASPAGATVSGEIRFPAGAEPNLDASPALVVAYFRTGAPGGGYAFGWLTGKAEGGAKAFELRAAGGELSRLGLWSRDWAATADSWSFEDAGRTRARAKITAAAGVPVRGTLRFADGRPYRAPGRAFAAAFVGQSGQWGRSALADEDGRFETSVAPGRYEVDVLGRSDERATGRPSFFALVSSAGATVEPVLRDADAGLRVDSAALEGHFGTADSDFVVGRPAGSTRELAPCSLEGNEVFMTRSPDDRWVNALPASWDADPQTAWVPAGVYDFYAVRIKESPWPSLRVIASARNVTLKKGKVAAVSLPGPAYPGGGAILSGRFPPAAPDAAGVAAARTWFDLCPRAFPSVELYDAEGRLAAVFAAGTSEGDGRAFKDAVWKADAAGMAALMSKPRAYKIGGLAPGTYRARARPVGGPAWEKTVVLTQDAETALDVEAR